MLKAILFTLAILAGINTSTQASTTDEPPLTEQAAQALDAASTMAACPSTQAEADTFTGVVAAFLDLTVEKTGAAKTPTTRLSGPTEVLKALGDVAFIGDGDKWCILGGQYPVKGSGSLQLSFGKRPDTAPSCRNGDTTCADRLGHATRREPRR